MFIIYLLHYSIYLFMLCVIPVQYGINASSQKISTKIHDNSTWHRNLCINSGKKILKQINSDIIGYVPFLKE